MATPRQCRIVVERNVPVPMRDGTILRADVWHADDGRRHPVLLQRLPYDKSDSQTTAIFSGIEPLRAAEMGFVVVIQDVRGRFESDGEFRVFLDESDDGTDTVAWAAALPWSDGTVGMYGISYVGATQLLAAKGLPPALRAIAPHLTSSECYDHWTYRGGALQLGFVLLWALDALAGHELARRELRGGVAPGLREAHQRLLEDVDAAYRTLPLTALSAVNDLVPAYADWLAHPDRDAYWQAIDPSHEPSDMRLAGMHVGGWYDLFLGGTLANYTRMRGDAPDGGDRPGQRLIVGPWAHGVVGGTIGELDFGPSAAEAALDMTRLQLDWFRSYLGPEAAGHWDGASVRLFVMGSNRWMDAADWPVPGTHESRFYLHADGRLGEDPPKPQAGDRAFIYDPADPVPTIGGATFLPGVFVGHNAGPRDQRPVSSRADVLAYRSAPLERDLTVVGPVSVVAHASSSARDTDWTAKLVDIWPDGREMLVCDGIIRARYREGTERGVLLEPDRAYRYVIDLGATAMTFKTGHSIGVHISSSNFPRFDRNPNHGGIIAEAKASDLLTAWQRVHHDPARASFLTLAILE